MLNIDLPPELEDALRLQAAQNGVDVGDFVAQAVREKINRTSTFQEVCAPFAEAVKASGASDEDFDRFFEDRRNDAWRLNQGDAT